MLDDDKNYIAPPEEKALFTFHYILSVTILSLSPLSLSITFKNSGEDGNGRLLSSSTPVTRLWSLDDSVCREDVKKLMCSEGAKSGQVSSVDIEPGGLGVVLRLGKEDYVVDSEVIWEESHPPAPQ